jgi:ribulose-phosphate 3-epimerase
MTIIPAIIPKSCKDLEEKLEVVKGLVSSVHIDITDGKYAGVASWPIEHDRGEFLKIRNQEMGMPHWEDFDFEVHLMTVDPTSYVNEWIEAGATRIVLHVESLNYKDDIQFLDKIKTEGLVEIGIAVNADIDINDLTLFLEVADFVHIMTIPEVGFQGATFDQRGVENIKWVKQNHPNMIVSVDGAMNPDTIEIVRDAGADRVIVGSYIFKNPNPREAVAELQSLL